MAVSNRSIAEVLGASDADSIRKDKPIVRRPQGRPLAEVRVP